MPAILTGPTQSSTNTEHLLSKKDIYNTVHSFSISDRDMSTSDSPATGVNIDTGGRYSPDLYGASPKRPHEAGGSHPGKRKMGDRDDAEVDEEALCTAKKHREMQPSARSDRYLGSSQPKTDTQTQNIDKMDIDSSNKEDEQDSSL